MEAVAPRRVSFLVYRRALGISTGSARRAHPSVLPLSEVFVLALLALAGLSGSAHASAYYFLDVGTRGMARGGAFVAGVDDLSAQYYNPAGLIHLGRPQAMLNFSEVHQFVRFERVDYGLDGAVSQEYDAVENDFNPMEIPALSVGHNFGLKNAYFAFGLYTPFSPDMAWPSDGPQNNTLVDALVWQTWAGPSAAWRPLPWLTVGGGVAWSLMRAEQSLAIELCLDNKSDDLDGDGSTTGTADAGCPEEPVAIGGDTAGNDRVDIAMKMLDRWTLTWNAGVLIEPKPWISIGLSVMPPMKVDGDGSLTVDAEGKKQDGVTADDHWLLVALEEEPLSDDDISVRLQLPLTLRSGVAIRPTDRSEIELAGVFQRWSQTETITIDDLSVHLAADPDNTDPLIKLPPDGTSINGPVYLPANYQDAWSVRLGGHYDVADPVRLRGGVFYETSGVPDATQGVNLADGNKIGFGLGGSVKAGKHLTVDIGGLGSFMPEIDIQNSDVRRLEVAIDPLTASNPDVEYPITNGKVVGNGKFKSSIAMASVGLTWAWGKDTRTAD